MFVLRIWREDVGNGQGEWRGELNCLADGEARYFRDWATLIAHLTQWLSESSQRGTE